MSDARARQDLGIDLNEAVRDHDDVGVGIDLNEPVRHPVVEVGSSNPIDGWDEVRQEDVFDFSNNPLCWDANGEDGGFNCVPFIHRFGCICFPEGDRSCKFLCRWKSR